MTWSKWPFDPFSHRTLLFTFPTPTICPSSHTTRAKLPPMTTIHSSLFHVARYVSIIYSVLNKWMEDQYQNQMSDVSFLKGKEAVASVEVKQTCFPPLPSLWCDSCLACDFCFPWCLSLPFFFLTSFNFTGVLKDQLCFVLSQDPVLVQTPLPAYLSCLGLLYGQLLSTATLAWHALSDLGDHAFLLESRHRLIS